MKTLFILAVGLLLTCADPSDPEKLVRVTKGSPMALLYGDFTTCSNLDSIPKTILQALKETIRPDSLRMLNSEQKSRSTSTDLGRRLHLFGKNQTNAFIVYDRLGCRAGSRILVLFETGPDRAAAVWAAHLPLDFERQVTNLDQIYGYWENGQIQNCPLRSDYNL